MIHILTLKVGNKYGPEYVNNLYDGILRNYSGDVKFYCYTEDISGLNENIQIVTLHNPDKFHKQWHKLEFHRTNFAGIPVGEKCLILDIDWIITNNLDDVLNWEFDEDIAVFERWWSVNRDQCKLNGGFQMFYMGRTNNIWKEFEKNPWRWQHHYYERGLCANPFFGEQNFINDHARSKSWLPKQWFGKYVKDKTYLKFILKQWMFEIKDIEPFFFEGEFASSIRMIHFADNDNMIHEHNEKWISKYWKGV